MCVCRVLFPHMLSIRCTYRIGTTRSKSLCGMWVGPLLRCVHQSSACLCVHVVFWCVAVSGITLQEVCQEVFQCDRCPTSHSVHADVPAGAALWGYCITQVLSCRFCAFGETDQLFMNTGSMPVMALRACSCSCSESTDGILTGKPGTLVQSTEIALVQGSHWRCTSAINTVSRRNTLQECHCLPHCWLQGPHPSPLSVLLSADGDKRADQRSTTHRHNHRGRAVH